MQHEETRLRTVFFLTEAEEASTALHILPQTDFLVEILTGLKTTDENKIKRSIDRELPSLEEIRLASVDEDRRKSLLFVERISRNSRETRR